MGCRERATTDLQSLLSRSRRIGAIVRRLGGLLDSTRGESCLSGKRLRLIAPTAFWFQHDLVAVCDPGVGSWSSWHATARARPMSGCQATRSQDVCQSVNRVLPLTLTFELDSGWRLQVTFALAAAAVHRGFARLSIGAALAVAAALAIFAAGVLLALLHGGCHVFARAARLAILHRALVVLAATGNVFGIGV